jgi:hypothetical protein
MMYNKLFTKILDSSVWLAPDTTRLVWITMLASMDEDGFVAMKTPQNVANRALIPLPAAISALHTLESEDPEDKACPYHGKRLERVADGWVVLKAGEYRDIITRATRRVQTRERVKRFRERCNANIENVTNPSVYATATATDTEKEESVKKSIPAGLDTEAWGQWFEYRAASKNPIKPASVEAAQREMAKLGDGQMEAVQHSIASGYRGLFPPGSRKTQRRWE